MSISVVKEKGVTLVTVATDRTSMLPLLCQILKALCCRPAGNSVNKGTTRSSVVRALGTVQIMVGVFNIGLGPARIDAYPYWLGTLFIVAGTASVLADTCPLPCLVGFSAIINIIGSIFAIVGIVLYAIHLANLSVIWMCGSSIPLSSDANCTYLAYLAQRLLTGMDITLIVMSVLQLCVSIGLAVLGIRALCYRGMEEDVRDAEIYQSLLKEVLIPGA